MEIYSWSIQNGLKKGKNNCTIMVQTLIIALLEDTMRLWHEALLPHLPQQWLLGQHRECCGLRGKGWGRKHKTVDYVFRHPYKNLVMYHWVVIDQLRALGCNTAWEWDCANYRGKNCPAWEETSKEVEAVMSIFECGRPFPIYEEHDEEYLKECIDLLAGRGVHLNIEDIKA